MSGKSVTSLGPGTSAFPRQAVSVYRSACRSRAAATRARTTAVGSGRTEGITWNLARLAAGADAIMLGVVLYALSLTLGCFMWMKGLMHEWYSTMYGVYYFAGGAWTMLATVYVITMILDRQGVISKLLHDHQYYFIGSLLFAFTVFYAYVTFAQYFIIWNANMPEETFWYVLRERGNWWGVSMVIIFGHFLVPFLALLRIDVKNVFKFMVPLCAWAWLMHWVDMAFNIMPTPHPDGYPLYWIWLPLGCFAFMGGLLSWRFLVAYAAHPPYPLRDPRMIEAMGFAHPVPTQISGGELDETDDLHGAPEHGK